jgi:hypothetical protein
MRGRISYAKVVATLALVLAMGTGGDILKGAVRSKQIKDGTIGTKDLSAKARKALRGKQGARGLTGATGATGAPGASGIGLHGFFGDGSDGDVTVASDTTLTRDMFYDDLPAARSPAAR